MHSEFGGFENRRRQRIRARLMRSAFLVVVLAAFSYWAYTLGYDHGESASGDLRNRFVALSEQVDGLRAETDAAIAARVVADERAAMFQKRYAAEAPQGEAKNILAVVNQRLAEGIGADRITSVISTVTNDTRCEPEIESRRFLVDTPLTNHRQTVSFANNTVTVRARGISVRNADGNVEAWYDPSEPVVLQFATIGGSESPAEGLVPFHHSLVVDNVEHRFVITEASRTGYLQVTAQKCEYP